jgi:hypothetical protein
MYVFFTFKLRNKNYLMIIEKRDNKLWKDKLFKLEFKTAFNPIKGRISLVIFG